MDIFERDNLPVVAGVEQVCLRETNANMLSFHKPYLELFNGVDGARQDAEDIGRRDGAASGQPRSHVRHKQEMAGLSDHPLTLSMDSNSNKVRIIALYIQYREGVPDEDRRRLYQHARLTRIEMDAINALVHLGVRINRVRTCARDR